MVDLVVEIVEMLVEEVDYKCYGLTSDLLISTSVPLVSDMSVGINNEGFQYGEED